MTENTENQLSQLEQRIKQALQQIREQSATNLSVEKYRAAFDALSELHPQQHDVTVEAFDLQGLSAEWLIPSAPLPDRVILYFHSGTYINGSLATDRMPASILAHVTSTKVLQIGYRLAPEHPFPAAVYDGLSAYHWLLAHRYGADTIGLVGSAAGGGIMLAVLLLARDQGSPLPIVAAGISPWLDLTPEGLRAKRQVTTDIVLNASLLEYAAKNYVRPEDASQPLVSPLYADLHGLPPLFLVVGQHEILHDDAHKLAKQAEVYQSRARCITWDNMFHGWHAFADILPEGQLALEQIAAYFEKYFALARGTWPDDTITHG